MKIKMLYSYETNQLAIKSQLNVTGIIKQSLTVTQAENIGMNEVKFLNEVPKVILL